jgi:cysteine desulfurase
MEQDAKRLSSWRDKLEARLLNGEETYLNGDKRNRLPHVTNLSFKYVEGNSLITALSKNMAVSTGSACTSASPEPSYVLKSLGLGDELAHSSLRFSLGRFTTEEEIDYVIEKITSIVNKIRETSPVWKMYKEGVAVNDAEWAHG